jgi:polyphosphate kinase
MADFLDPPTRGQAPPAADRRAGAASEIARLAGKIALDYLDRAEVSWKADDSMRFNHLVVAPTDMRDGLVMRIRREAEHARTGRPARIVAKVNSLVDPILIEELYRASGDGVQIDLIVRGICCLRPGVPGLSDRIRAVSIVDRFLEHARVFYFKNHDAPEYLLASADWMPRNLDRRVEIAFPVLDPALCAQLAAILDVQLGDTVKARLIGPDGTSQRISGASGLRSQERLWELTHPVR